jgi:histone deacetylase 1/2
MSNPDVPLPQGDSTTEQGRPPQRRIVFVWDEGTALYDLGEHARQHAMKPWRGVVVHALVRALGLIQFMQVVRPPPLPEAVLDEHHTAEYLQALRATSQQAWQYAPAPPLGAHFAAGGQSLDQAYADALASGQEALTAAVGAKMAGVFTPGTDCPPVEGGWAHAVSVAGGTVYGAALLASGAADTAIHWAGGMHHARAGECSGFCYINDIVLGIHELLRVHARVLYVDLDVHHGDGVEEAFYRTGRVFSISLHKFAEGFFPGTGHPSDIGIGRGRYSTLNVPLRDGTSDSDFFGLFRAAFDGAMRVFEPTAIVLQCGADSLSGDRLGGTAFRLSSAGHAACVRHARDANLPLLVLGGGGYTVRNVAKLWAYETAVLCGMDGRITPSTSIPIPPGPDAAELAAADPEDLARLTSDQIGDRALRLVFGDRNDTLLVAVEEGGADASSSVIAGGGPALGAAHVARCYRRIEEHMESLAVFRRAAAQELRERMERPADGGPEPRPTLSTGSIAS